MRQLCTCRWVISSVERIRGRWVRAWKSGDTGHSIKRDQVGLVEGEI